MNNFTPVKNAKSKTMVNREVTILIADASAYIRSTFELVIGKSIDKPYKLVYATTVQEVLGHLKNHPVDLIITDLRLRDGEALLSLIRSREISPSIPIIVLSAYTDLAAKEELKFSGVDYFFEKPPELSKLQNAIFQSLKTTRFKK
jgi:CheY-like chemotaxis protein